MTGSASKRWTLCVSCDSLLRERVQGEGGDLIGPGGSLSDFCFVLLKSLNRCLPVKLLTGA